MEKPFVVCLVGPTACRKTEASILLAKALNGEIVSADSVAVYRGLDIGSAKPTEREQQGIIHHMIDVADPSDADFTVAMFSEKARAAIDSIAAKGRLPIVVGGSGLYCDAIFSDMRFSAPSDPTLRASLEKLYVEDPKAVFSRLQSVDPAASMRIHPNDAKRVIRALEVYEVSGKPFSEWNRDFWKVQGGDSRYDVLRFGLDMDRKRLYERIDRRVDQMFEKGLEKEAFSLFDRGLTPKLAALQSIGYAQLYDAYRGKCSVSEAKAQIKLDTRHFAKRQLTWFRRSERTEWFSVDTDETFSEAIDRMKERIKTHHDGNDTEQN